MVILSNVMHLLHDCVLLLCLHAEALVYTYQASETRSNSSWCSTNLMNLGQVQTNEGQIKELESGLDILYLKSIVIFC